MNQPPLRLALLTNVTQCADAVARVAAKRGWQILPFVSQPLPTKWQDRLDVNVYLVDLEMVDSIQKIAELRANSPQTPVVALLRTEHLPKLQSAMAAGATEFITFPTRSSQFIESVLNALQKPAASGSPAPNAPAAPPAAGQLPPYQRATYNQPGPQPTNNLSQGDFAPGRPAPGGARQSPPLQPARAMPPHRAMNRNGSRSANAGTSALRLHGRRLVAVASLRGGAGRSTIALNLAVALRERLGLEVTLAEMHHGISNLAPMLGLRPQRTLADLVKMQGQMDEAAVRDHLTLHQSGVRLLAAPMSLSDLVEIPLETTQNILSLLPGTAACTVVDTLSATDEMLSELLLRADDVIVVATPDVIGVRSTLALLQMLTSEQGVGARIHVVLNRADLHGGLDESAIRKQLPVPISVSLPDDSSLALYAINRGVPFVGSYPRATVSKRIHDLAEALYAVAPASSNGQPRHQNALMALFNR